MPTPPRVTWTGSTQLTRTKRGYWKFNAQDVTCNLEYEGPYDACLASVPLIGDVVAGYTSYGVKVFDVTVEPLEGSKGRLTVILRNPYTLQTVSNPDFTQVGDPIAQLLWQPFKRRIESHPLCGTSSLPAGTVSGDVEHIQQANYVPVAGGWTFAQYQSLLQAGITDYDEKQPLLTLTTHAYSRPLNLGENNFTLDEPDASVLPVPPNPINSDGSTGTWQWLRGGDDLQRQDKLWKLVQSWTGFNPSTQTAATGSSTSQASAFQLLYGEATG